MCNKIVDTEAKSYSKETKLFQQILMKKAICKEQNFYVLLALLIITIALFIAVSI